MIAFQTNVVSKWNVKFPEGKQNNISGCLLDTYMGLLSSPRPTHLSHQLWSVTRSNKLVFVKQKLHSIRKSVQAVVPQTIPLLKSIEYKLTHLCTFCTANFPFTYSERRNCLYSNSANQSGLIRLDQEVTLYNPMALPGQPQFFWWKKI